MPAGSETGAFRRAPFWFTSKQQSTTAMRVRLDPLHCSGWMTERAENDAWDESEKPSRNGTEPRSRRHHAPRHPLLYRRRYTLGKLALGALGFCALISFRRSSQILSGISRNTFTI